MSSDLTSAQTRILDFIRNSMVQSGYPPTRQEIATAMGYRIESVLTPRRDRRKRPKPPAHHPGPWEYSIDTNGYHIKARSCGVVLNIATAHGMRPDDANLIVSAPELLALAHKYAKECGECAGTRLVPDGSGGNESCSECMDIWAVIDRAEGRTP